MQDWREQAKKNGIKIIDKGECQLCGAHILNGIVECVEKLGLISHRLNRTEGVSNMTIFKCVDSHALQHSEIHGKWNNHFHLSRLNLILQQNIKWSYKYSTILSNVLDEYKTENYDEEIKSPETKKRGVLTIADIEGIESENEYKELVNKWAKYVYESYAEGHKISEKISKIFIDKINA